MTEIEALEEIQSQVYRNTDGCEMVISKECYKTIIAVLEKQIPKKSVHDGCFDKDGVWHEWNGVNGRPYELCPCCGKNLCCEMPYDPKPNYCLWCGQKLKWSDEE